VPPAKQQAASGSFRIPRPARDAVRNFAKGKLTAAQAARARSALTNILHASEDLAALGEEQDSVFGMLIRGFATSIRDRAKELLDVLK
jgi:hypothetical protein